MVEAARDLLAFTDVQARRLAGVSMRRLRYWEQVGLVVPSIKKKLSPHNTVRLYSFQDLLALLVVSELRTERDMSLQRIRRLVAHLRSRIEIAARRQAQDSGQVVKRRGVHASAPVFAGTRIRVSTVQDYLRRGFATEAILEAFPDLRSADVEEARRLLAAAG